MKSSIVLLIILLLLVLYPLKIIFAILMFVAGFVSLAILIVAMLIAITG